ncbi:hypothetical protein OQA88_8853 [Cercophora sp. LCS_1]
MSQRSSTSLDAAEALQRAADAMVIATESFKRQLQAREVASGRFSLQDPRPHERPSATPRQAGRHDVDSPPILGATPTWEHSVATSDSTARPLTRRPLPEPPGPNRRHHTRQDALPSISNRSLIGRQNPTASSIPSSTTVFPASTVPSIILPTIRTAPPTSPSHRSNRSHSRPHAAQEYTSNLRSQRRRQPVSPSANKPVTTTHHVSDSPPLYPASSISSGYLPRRRPLPALPMAPAAPSTRPACFTPFHEVLFVLLICLAQAMMLAGLAQALLPAGIIAASFPEGAAGDVAWYSAAYSLTSATFVLPSGRLGDLFGHKRVFVMGWVWFAVWSLVAGFARVGEGRRGTVFFCVCRGLQGIGPALLVPNGQALMGRVYKPGVRKNMVMCLFGASAPFGFVMGAIFSSLLAERAGWSWAFWITAIVCLLLAATSVVILPTPELPVLQPLREGKGVPSGLWERLDGWGMLLGVTGLILFNFAFNQAPIVSWGTPYTYFILIIGMMMLLVFVWYERRARYPLIPISSMDATANFVLGCTGAGWACFSVWLYYLVYLMETLRGWSPLMASVGLLPAPITGLAASILAGFLMSRVKPHWVMLISMCAFLIGSILLATAPVWQIYWLNTFFGILIMPFGMDMSNPAATILMSNSVAKEHQGIAASLVVTTVNYSISIALGIAATVETQINYNMENPMLGFRAAQYFGTGIGGLGVLLALCFLVQSSYRRSAGPQLAGGGR